MIYFLLGPDNFTKNEFISNLATKDSGEVVVFQDSENLPSPKSFTQQTLFGAKKIYLIKNLFSQIDWPEAEWDALAQSAEVIIFSEASLDKRVKKTKYILANKKITAKQFNLPSGKELDKWIIARVKELGGQIDPETANLLAEKMGRDLAVETKVGGQVVSSKEIFDLWQVDSELNKMLFASADKKINTEIVQQLANENVEIDVFKITNAAAEGNRVALLNLVDQFLSGGESSDKGKFIQLVALLGEQFRNVLMVQDFLSRRVREAEILEITQWKPGRLFVMTKMAKKLDPKKVKDLLVKLELFDLELKTSDTPPRVLLDLILSSFA